MELALTQHGTKKRRIRETRLGKRGRGDSHAEGGGACTRRTKRSTTPVRHRAPAALGRHDPAAPTNAHGATPPSHRTSLALWRLVLVPVRAFVSARPARASSSQRIDLVANDQLPDLMAPPIVAEHLVEAARGIVWDVGVAPPIVAVDPFGADMPGGGPAMHPGAYPDVLVDYDDADDDDVWARAFGGPPLQTVSHTASTANAAVDAASRRPSSPTELGLDAANRGNSMGDGPTQQPTAFPRFGTRGVSSPTVVVARPGQLLSFATPTPVPVLGATPHRYRSHLPARFTSSRQHAGRRRARHPQPRKRLETPRCSTYS